MSDEASDPARYFGREVRRARLAAGLTLVEFGRRAGYHHAQVSRIERGVRPATLKFAQMCDRVFPERGGWFEDFYRQSRKWPATPPWFRNWIEHEQRAVTLKVWQPSQLSGLLQTEDYALAQLRTYPGATEKEIAERLASRMARQAILTREDPAAPMTWFLVDEAALHRCTGTAEIMGSQLDRLVEVTALPNVTIQVVPNVAHAALTGGFAVADKPDGEAAYLETALTGQVFEDSTAVQELATIFDALRTEALRGTESLRLIEKVASEWKP
jgi:Domain of unknown function (DUF5753)/Helix-turn-helix domain